ncbi:hypothetical protein ABBQ38_014827 [Trebouxia sp. C0009 RCD-2024]
MVHRIALVRHGQSKFNLEKKFTGWTDINLTETGEKEAIQAGELLRTEGFEFDVAFCSVLKRSIKTLSLILEELDQLWVPVEKSWRLNERHYGELQEVSKTETAKKFGDKQLREWRRGYDSAPAPLEKGKDDARYPGKDRRYASLDSSDLPLTESLKQTIDRVLPYWYSNVLPAVQAGKRCIIVGHGNSIRALVKILDDVSNDDIRSVETPTGVPLIYELNDNMKAVRHFNVGTAQAFTRRLGVLGVNVQAERMLHAFVSRGLELRLQEIKYHAQGKDNEIESLTGICSKDSDAEVVSASDVLFLFAGSVQGIKDIIASNKRNLQKNQILVAVARDGEGAGGKGVKVLQAMSKDEMKWAKDNPVAARVALRKGSQASEMDRNIVKTIFEAAGFVVVKEGSLDQT